MSNLLTTIIIHVTDMDQSIRFYGDLLGLTARMTSENWSEFEAGGTTIALHTQFPGHEGNANGIPQLCLAVYDLDARCEILRQGGVEVSGPAMMEGVGILATCSDPDGVSFSLSEAA